MSTEPVRDALAFGSDSEYDSSIRVNRKFAASYDQKKRIEALSKAKHMQEDDEDESDSEDEDDDGLLITPNVEKSFLELLPKLAARRKEIYETGTNYFPNYEEIVEESKSTGSVGSKEKPFKMNDYVRESILKKMDGDKSDHDSEDEEARGPTPHEELMDIKKRLAQHTVSSDEEEDGDDFLVLRSKPETEKQIEDDEFKKWEHAKQQDEKLNPKKLKNLSTQDLLTHFWSVGDTDDKNESFLRKFIVNEGWIDKDRDRIPSYHEIIDEDQEDLKDIEEQEKFEEKYNFRFEEPGGAEITSHPRTIEDSVRRKSDKRKRKREQARDKKALKKVQKKEELKRLKNLKKEEILSKMEEIQKVTESKDLTMHEGTLQKLLEGDYDPEQYDKQMESIFSEQYYGEEGGPHGEGAHGEDEGAYGEADYDEGIYDENYDEGYYEEGVETQETKKERKKKKKAALLSDPSIPEKFVDEYYNLNYEDMIDDTPVRFGYTKVKADSFGLDIMDILEAEEKDLNQFLPLKHLAPYRTKEPKPRTKWNRKRKRFEDRSAQHQRKRQKKE